MDKVSISKDEQLVYEWVLSKQHESSHHRLDLNLVHPQSVMYLDHSEKNRENQYGIRISFANAND